MNLTELRATLDRLGVQPNKSLGQNFLVDAPLAEWIVEQLEIQPDDAVIEVGPGLGALTEALAARARRLILIEKDAKLAQFLRERFAGQEHVEVLHADATRHDIRPLFADRPVRFIGNLPYSCGGEIMRRFLTPPHPFAAAVVMLQKEVADRLVAVPRTKAYGAFTLLNAAFWQARALKQLGSEPFFPRPEIASTVVRLLPWPPKQWPAFDHRLFARLVKQGFSQRRKQLKNLLPAVGVDWENCRAEANLGALARAEELDLGQWLALTNAADDHPLKAVPQSGGEIFDLVDERDVVIGQAPRREVHAKNLLHRAVHAFVFNRQGELFLQKRSWLKDAHPGKWDSSAAGHLDSSEDYDQAVIRELEEELGIAGVTAKPLAKIAAGEMTGWEHVVLYETTWDRAVRYPCSEIETGEFFPLEVIDRWIARRPEDFATGFLTCYATWRRMEAKP